MTPPWQTPFRLHARTPQHAARVRGASAIIAQALATTAPWYVAFSGGLDSTVLLALVRAAAPTTVAVWSNDEWNYPETEAFVAATPHCLAVAATIRHSAWFTSWPDGPVRLPPGTIWVDVPHNDGLQTYARQAGYRGAFLGLRADEAGYRKRHLARYGSLFCAKGTGVWHANPLAAWTRRDVWAYLLARDLPYNAAYDRLWALGVPMERQRVGPFAVERALGYGQLAILKAGWPALWNRFAARYPQARAFV